MIIPGSRNHSVNEDCSVFIMIKVQSILFPRERNSNALGRSLSALGNTSPTLCCGLCLICYPRGVCGGSFNFIPRHKPITPLLVTAATTCCSCSFADHVRIVASRPRAPPYRHHLQSLSNVAVRCKPFSVPTRNGHCDTPPEVDGL